MEHRATDIHRQRRRRRRRIVNTIEIEGRATAKHHSIKWWSKKKFHYNELLSIFVFGSISEINFSFSFVFRFSPCCHSAGMNSMIRPPFIGIHHLQLETLQSKAPSSLSEVLTMIVALSLMVFSLAKINIFAIVCSHLFIMGLFYFLLNSPPTAPAVLVHCVLN